MRIAFIGPPGSGKGTQAQRLKDYLGIAHLSTGEMLRDAHQAGSELGRRAAEFMDAGKLVPDDIVLGVVVERLTEPDCAAGCLFDGFPRTVPQARALDELLAERGMPLDLVVSLELPESLLKERLLARGRHDDNEATIDERFRHHRQLTEPLLDYYRGRGILRLINGQGEPDDVFARIKQAIDSAAA
jgi:adenylate kinase